MADIHGEYEKYKKLLEAIDLRESDKLYVLGDVLDRGPQSMETLLDMMRRPNVTLLAGNHEYAALSVLPKLTDEITAESITALSRDDDFARKLLGWRKNGGQATINGFRRLSRRTQQDVLEYLGEALIYEKLTVNGREYLLVHAGLGNFSPERPIEDYSLRELIFERPDYSLPYYADKVVVTGHTPTRLIAGHDSNTIFMRNNHINIDCGATFGGRLAAIRLDDGRHFYV
jgi:serine/threonine protein phosphatase 1